MFANGEGKCAQNSPNHFTERQPRRRQRLCRTILNFRRGATNRYSFAYKSKQNNCNFANRILFGRLLRSLILNVRALAPVLSSHSIPSTIVVHFRMCSANQLNFQRNGNAYTQHTRAYTYFRLQFPYHETMKKTVTAQNYTGPRFPCQILRCVHIYGFSIQICAHLLTGERKMHWINATDGDGTRARAKHRSGSEKKNRFRFIFFFSSSELPYAGQFEDRRPKEAYIFARMTSGDIGSYAYHTLVR